MTPEQATQLAQEHNWSGAAFQNGDASFTTDGQHVNQELVYSHFFFARELADLLEKPPAEKQPICTIVRFKSGKINKAGTAFTTAATVARQQHTGGPFYTSLPDVVEALERQGVTDLNIWKALYIYRGIGALTDVGEGFLKWAYDPRPFAAKEEQVV